MCGSKGERRRAAASACVRQATVRLRRAVAAWHPSRATMKPQKRARDRAGHRARDMPALYPLPTLTDLNTRRTVELAIDVHDASQSDRPCQAVRTQAANSEQEGQVSGAGRHAASRQAWMASWPFLKTCPLVTTDCADRLQRFDLLVYRSSRTTQQH